MIKYWVATANFIKKIADLAWYDPTGVKMTHQPVISCTDTRNIIKNNFSYLYYNLQPYTLDINPMYVMKKYSVCSLDLFPVPSVS
jgi:hypothetical protein